MTIKPEITGSVMTEMLSNFTRNIADTTEIRDASITLDRTGTERWGEWVITTQYLKYTGGGAWVDCYQRDEFFERTDAVRHGRDQVSWITNRASLLSE